MYAISAYVFPTGSTTSGNKTRQAPVPSLFAPNSFKHYRRSVTNRAPRKRTFLVTMTKYNANSCAPAGAYSHNVAMLNYGVCCKNCDEIPCDENGNGSYNGNIGNNNDGNDKNNNNDDSNYGPHHFGSNGGFWQILQFFGNALIGAFALVTAVATFPAASSATMSTFASSTRLGMVAVRGRPTALSSSPDSQHRSKVMHLSCKGSTLVVPLSSIETLEPSSTWQRCKIVDVPIELTGRELAIINRRQYCVRESMLV